LEVKFKKDLNLAWGGDAKFVKFWWKTHTDISKKSPEIICVAVVMYDRIPLSLWQVEDLLHERGVDISNETVRIWQNRFGQVFA
jgi:hypothetical protein